MTEILSHLKEEEGYQALGYRELIDATQATATFSPGDAWSIATILRNLGHKVALGPTAIIVSNELSFGMIRMVGLIADDVCEVRPFRAHERAEAEEWLATAPIAPVRDAGDEKKNSL